MKFSVSIPCLFKNTDFCEAIKKVADLGFDAIETWSWQDLNLLKVKKTCEEHGVELIGMCTTEFNLVDTALRQKWLDGLKESCVAANTVGAKALITQTGNDTGEDREIQHKNIVETLKMAIPILEEYNVMIMLEPLNTKIDHVGHYLWSSKEGFDIIREVNHPLVKLVYDIYHQQIMEGDIVLSIVNNLDCIAHLHSAGHPGKIEPYLGENNYKIIFDAVEKAGYKGLCGLEYNPTINSEESLLKVKESYQ